MNCSLIVLLGLATTFSAFPAQAGNCLCGNTTLSDTTGPMEGLLVSGHLLDGTGSLAPAYPLRWLEVQQDQGPYSLVFRDAAGDLLNKVYFTPQPHPAADQGQGTPFSLVVPYTAAMRNGLVAVELYQGETRLASLRATRQDPAVAPLLKDPVARVLRPGVVRLGWDCSTHPGAMVKDGETGHELAMAQGGTVDLETFATELEVCLSDGLRSLHRRVKVASGGPMPSAS